MRLAVSTDKACTVNREHDIGVVAADIMDDLIIGPLHKGRIHGVDRLHPLHGECCAERRGMLLGNADIDHPVREFLGKRKQS
ncbi:hypothetical protein D3C85_1695030 [compost metagenome]